MAFGGEAVVVEGVAFVVVFAVAFACARLQFGGLVLVLALVLAAGAVGAVGMKLVGAGAVGSSTSSVRTAAALVVALVVARVLMKTIVNRMSVAKWLG